MVFAQTRLYIRGSAVPGGMQQLTRFSTKVSGQYTFKFHGKLLPGDLYITTTDSPRAASRYYAPKLVDTNIVTEKADYTQKADSTGAEWAVLFEADNYRFTVDVTNKQVSGELFAQWYEAWICGGCVEDEQGKGTDQEGHWQIASGKQMEQSWEDRNVFDNGSDDYKWRIINDGYYRIRINVFEETIEGEYLGTELPDGIRVTPEVEADIRVEGREIKFHADKAMTVRLFRPDGSQQAATSGTDVTLIAPEGGVYILSATNGQQGTTWKILVE